MATMRAMRTQPSLVLLATLLAAAPLAAQDREDARFRIGLGLAGGRFRFDTDGSNLQDRTDAGLFRLSFEATSARGIGGGARLEGFGSDDDLFADSGFTPAEASDGSLFGHFTYRLESHRFAMPLRVGLLFHGLTLTDQTTDAEITYASVGPMFEIAPEFTLVHRGKTTWSLFGEVGVGVGGTAIDVDGDSNNYDSVTSFFGLELGTRVQFGPIELGLSYLGRWQSMDESDPEGGLVVLGYDADFQGLQFGFAVVF